MWFYRLAKSKIKDIHKLLSKWQINVWVSGSVLENFERVLRSVWVSPNKHIQNHIFKNIYIPKIRPKSYPKKEELFKIKSYLIEPEPLPLSTTLIRAIEMNLIPNPTSLHLAWVKSVLHLLPSGGPKAAKNTAEKPLRGKEKMFPLL